MPAQQIGQPLKYMQKWAFVVEIEGVVVGGFSKAGPLKLTFGVVEQTEGGAITVVDYSISKYKPDPVTLERGGSNNIELWTWVANQKKGIVDKRNVSIAAQDGQGNVTARWKLPTSIVKEFNAGDFDSKNETENIIESMVIQPADMDRTAA